MSFKGERVGSVLVAMRAKDGGIEHLQNHLAKLTELRNKIQKACEEFNKENTEVRVELH